MRILGIDYGHKRLGLALSDEQEILASPLLVYVRRTLTKDLDYLSNLVIEKKIGAWVIGLPKNTDGSVGTMATETLEFGDRLSEKTNLPMKAFDEQYTSIEAERVLIQAGMTRKKRKMHIDSLSAVLILQGFLNSKKQ